MSGMAARRQFAERSMSSDNQDIRRTMSEIADWLHSDTNERTATARLRTFPEESTQTDEETASLDSIIERRLAAQRARAPQSEQRMVSPIRDVMDRLSGPIDSSRRGPLSAAIADILERQRTLDSAQEERLPPAPTPAPASRPDFSIIAPKPIEAVEPAAPQPAPAPAPTQSASADMEKAFERLVTGFEERASHTFQSLEASLADVRRLIEEAKTPIEAAEAAAAYIVQTRIHDLETETNERIETVARDLAQLRTDTRESERRTGELLDEVRRTLEQVAARLPMNRQQPLSSTPDPVPAPEPRVELEDNPTVRAQTAAPQVTEESATEEEPLALVRRVEQKPARSRYIAAARRSTKADNELAQAADKYRAAASTSRKRGERRAGQSALRRTMLGTAAAAAVLIGVYAGSSQILDSIFAKDQTAYAVSGDVQTAEAPKNDIAEADNNSLTAAVPPPADDGRLFAPPAASERIQSAFAPHDPMTTGSIPTALALPLPAEIGGELLRSRAEAGDAAAQFEVGTRYADGRGVSRNLAQAAIWFERAAEQNFAPAQYKLGSMYEKGVGRDKDAQKAKRLYEAAANGGNVQAMHNLGVLHAEGALGEPDLVQAQDWFNRAAEYGSKDSQYNLGILSARGISGPQNFEKAYVWFALAAAQGDKDAAEKRDQIAAKLNADELRSARVSADTWQPRASMPEANVVAAPAGGWDQPASGRASTTAQ